METNQNTRFTNVSYSPWNLEKMDADQQQHDILHDQIPIMHSVWPPNYPFHQLHQIPSSSSSSSPSVPSSSSSTLIPSSGFLNDILGIQLLEEDEEPEEELGAMKEMLYKIAAMQPVDIDPATIRKPKRRNVRISDDPQSVAARHRRERISEKIRILQRLVPGGTKMDTASMLDEAIRYVKFLKRQIRLLQPSPSPNPQCNIGTVGVNHSTATASGSLPPGTEWPFAPSIVSHGSKTTSSMDPLAGLGFNPPGAHAGDGSGGFNHEFGSWPESLFGGDLFRE